jgi:hypothetical protein
MSREVERRMSRSSEDFTRLVWPTIGRGFGRVIPVESVSEGVFATELDRRSGVDVWLVGVDEHMRGLASRVQWTDRSYDTFTVRVRSCGGGLTEYDKRRREIETNRGGVGGVVTPYYVTQGYVSKDRYRLVGAAIARMRDVIAAVEMDLGRFIPPNRDGSRGYAVPWCALRESGAQIRTWHVEPGRMAA